VPGKRVHRLAIRVRQIRVQTLGARHAFNLGGVIAGGCRRAVSLDRAPPLCAHMNVYVTTRRRALRPAPRLGPVRMDLGGGFD
jgi:hypothetical protein